MSPRVLVVEHHASCPPALVGEWLVAAGCTLETCRPYAGDRLPDPTAYDALLVLGGDMSAHDDATVPWLAPLKADLRRAVAAGMPVLGICLGHQLLAVALGGDVRPHPRGQTVGLRPVGWTEHADGDALVRDRTGSEVVVHWNNDVVLDLPEGAEVLARSPGGEVQVARFAPRAWGIQAHPEVDATLVRRWAVSDRDHHVALGLDQDAVLAEIEEAGPALVAHWQPVVARFAALVAASALVRDGGR